MNNENDHSAGPTHHCQPYLPLSMVSILLANSAVWLLRGFTKKQILVLLCREVGTNLSRSLVVTNVYVVCCVCSSCPKVFDLTRLRAGKPPGSGVHRFTADAHYSRVSPLRF